MIVWFYFVLGQTGRLLRKGPDAQEVNRLAAPPPRDDTLEMLLSTEISAKRPIVDPPELGPGARRRLEQALANKPADIVDTIEPEMTDLDEILSAQMVEIFQAPEFRTLEKARRGLHYLVRNGNTGDQLQIRVLNVSRHELWSAMDGYALKDFLHANEPKQARQPLAATRVEIVKRTLNLSLRLNYQFEGCEADFAMTAPAPNSP